MSEVERRQILFWPGTAVHLRSLFYDGFVSGLLCIMLLCTELLKYVHTLVNWLDIDINDDMIMHILISYAPSSTFKHNITFR